MAGRGDRIKAECPLLAQSGHADALNQCPLFGVKRTLHRRRSAKPLRHTRKRYAVVDLITSLAQSCMKAGYVDKESGEGWALMRVTAGDVWIAVGALTGLTLTIATASAAKPCLTQAEAQKRWPKAHLFWHTAGIICRSTRFAPATITSQICSQRLQLQPR